LKRSYGSRENKRLLGIATAVVVISTLYIARVVFIPLALASLLALLLTPPVAFLERIKLPRPFAIFAVALVLLGLMGLLGWQTSQQLVDLTNRLPTYTEALKDKINSMKGVSSQSFNDASNTVKELQNEIVKVTPGSFPDKDRKNSPAVLGSSSSHPLAVEVVPPTNLIGSVENMIGPMANVGLVTIFTIFILFGREDLRNRLVRLAGAGQLNLVTQAMDEASLRINRYLLLQFCVNSGYGLLIGVALHFIGVPNAALWGMGAAILRFLPYVGPLLAASMPILLALAVFPSWKHALATLGLFLVSELIVSNVVEPLLYGAHVGLSPLAILVAAVFWTLVWGLPGLVLSTPLTVCLVVIGRYVPSLNFLNVILGDEPVLEPHAKYYQRLLASDQNEARQILEESLKEKSLEEVYSSVIIPALSLAEQDRHRDELDEETQDFIYQSTREIVEELGDSLLQRSVEADGQNRSETPLADVRRPSGLAVLCIPARDDADDVIAKLLSQALAGRGYSAKSVPIGSVETMLSAVSQLSPGPSVVCISALPPFALSHTRALYARLREQFPELHIVVCLWQFNGDLRPVAMSLRMAKEDGFFTTLPDVIKHISLRLPRSTDRIRSRRSRDLASNLS
jgi:predicted PurR-regulated permease PerM